MYFGAEKRAQIREEILEHRRHERVELERLVSRLEPPSAWRHRRRIGTLLNQLEEYCHQVNTFLDTRDWIQAADSMMDVEKAAKEFLSLGD